jgi:hypothetical protein
MVENTELFLNLLTFRIMMVELIAAGILFVYALIILGTSLVIRYRDKYGLWQELD